MGYFLGFLDLVSSFGGWFGNTQLKSLCVISSLSLLVTVGVTSVSVTERAQLARYGEQKQSFFRKVLGVVMTLYTAILSLPSKIRLIFCVQFFSWYGWFIFLFYSSTWVGEVYTKYDTQLDNASKDQVGDIARVGSLSLTVFSTVSLIVSLILPEGLRLLNGNAESDTTLYPGSSFLSLGRLTRNPVYRRFRQGTRNLMSPFQSVLKSIVDGKTFFGKIDLTFVWFASQVIYAVTCFAMPYVKSLQQASIIVSFFGICWAVTTWVPFSLLAEEILILGQNTTSGNSFQTSSSSSSNFSQGSRAQDIEMIAFDHARSESVPQSAISLPVNGMHSRAMSGETIELHIVQPEFDEQDQVSPKRKKKYMPQYGNSTLSSDQLLSIPKRHVRNISLNEEDFYSDGSEVISTTGEHSGVYLGLHNVAITVPQLLSTFISFLVFSAMEPSQLNVENSEIEDTNFSSTTKNDGGFAIAVTMQLGGIAALISAYYVLQLRGIISRDTRNL